MKKIMCFLGTVFLGFAFLFVMTKMAQAYESISSQAEHTEFTKSIEDLPVMPGLEVVEDRDVLLLFGSQRIAQTTLKGSIDIDNVYYFYGSVLPELGWKRMTAKIYQRDGERLSMHPSSANTKGITFVRFAVEPIVK